MAEEEKKDSEAVETASEKEETSASGKVDSTSKDGAEVEVPAQFKKLVEEVEKMTVLELNELVKILEKKFGVSAQAVAVAASSGSGAGDSEGEEQSIFAVELTAVGDQKIAVIKAVKEVLGLGLKEAKDMVDGAPTMLKEGVEKKEAEEIKGKIEEAGGSVTLK